MALETATKLGIAVDDAVATVDSGSLDLQYVNRDTQLDKYNGGVAKGSFVIRDSNGSTGDDQHQHRGVKTLGDVIDAINSSNDRRARPHQRSRRRHRGRSTRPAAADSSRSSTPARARRRSTSGCAARACRRKSTASQDRRSRAVAVHGRDQLHGQPAGCRRQDQRPRRGRHAPTCSATAPAARPTAFR